MHLTNSKHLSRFYRLTSKMMTLSLLFLAVGVFAETQDCPNSATPTYLPDTSNCSIYYECIRGHQYQLVCPPGLLFNTDTNYCDVAEYVNCNDNTKDPLCPSAQGSSNVVYSEDCSKFYRCVDGKKQLNNCPENMYFNSKTSGCDYMDNVDCGSVPAPTIPSAATESSAATSSPSTPTVVPTTTGPIDPTCPASSGIIKIVDPDDCSKYYECNQGSKSLKSCPENLYFNPETLQCDYMDNVDCQAVPTRQTNPATESTRASRVTTTTTGPIDPTCPASSGITKFVYPEDCSKYYECNQGTKSLKSCPENLYFNPETLQCDYMDSVDCQAVPSRATNPTTESTRASTATTTTTGPVDPTCPASSGISKFVYPDDCSKYYECNNGKKSLKNCPENLYFNPVTLACDYMDSVDCKSVPSSTAAPVTPTTAIPTYTTVVPDNPTTTDPDCPTTGSTNIIYPYDCSKFYRCVNGQKQLKNCPENMYFNPSMGSCDYMDNVECYTSTAAPVSTLQPETTSTAKPTNAPVTAPTSVTTVAPSTVCEGKANGAFVANPDNCKQYYECANGQAYLFDCPTGTIWNEVIMSCSYSENEC
ncbi:uncharacterized protein [Diabrotica undecimpunctata]|uniref:uncharacterized protein isoform X2 n=1 Tax=Diabrotica undecimpunctata TaxID=50387 RepID=UPI003B63677D